jgi:transposase-like protein
MSSTEREGEMPRKSPFSIVLANKERATLEAQARRYTSSYREVIRAKIVLYAAAGMDNKEIAARLDTSPQIVCKWRKRFFEQRLEGLDDAPRHGRPGSFSPQRRHRRQGPGL